MVDSLREMRMIYFDTRSERESTGTINGSKKYKSLRLNVNIGFKPVIVLAHLQIQ